MSQYGPNVIETDQRLRLLREGTVIVVSPLSSVLGFGPLPVLFWAFLEVRAVTHLWIVQLVKRHVYKASGWRAA